ncbi:DUF427 domain-containing protein [Roseibium sp.]|uniref:DUF427 domain-containing protein n=1 Tax=Roseibium sp. TaxID=1936156 RepID=UPI003D0F09A4
MTVDPVFQSPAFVGAIRNPEDPNHLMVIKPVTRKVRVFAGETLLADTIDALRVIEVGRRIYDPVIYVPEQDLTLGFTHLDKSTHCPIKGDASYITFDGDEIGWVYKTPLKMSVQLANHFAFWPDKVRCTEGN